MDRGELRRSAGFAGTHALLLVAIWLTGAAVYAIAFAPDISVVWLAVDIALVAAAIVVLARNGKRAVDWRRVLALVVVAIGVAAASQAIIHDANAVWVDESNYLRTVREGIVTDGVAPFNIRWLAPFLAGSWNILPVDDAVALKAVNFGALVVTAVYLGLLVMRLRVRFAYALAAPVLLLCSYLGIYGATNRLVVDPLNYAAFVVLFHTLLRREHWRYFPFVLLVAACNSEKAIYWIPIFALVALVQAPLSWRHVRDVALLTVRYSAPALVYLVAIALYVHGSSTESSPSFFQNLHVMAFTWLRPKLTNPTVAANNFQMLWFPFGAFTVYALLGFVSAPRALRPIALLAIPIFLQAMIAYDTQRMIAYAFIVYLPFGFLYLSRAFADMPRWFTAPWFALMVAVAIAQYYVLPLKPHVPVNLFKLVLSTSELVLTGALIFVHHAFFARAEPPLFGPRS
jgi:hypothetical protein